MSTLKLYKSTKLLPDKNYIVDSLVDYLNSFTGTSLITISDFQYIKHSLSLSVKIDKSQSFLEFSNADNDFNYISIQNDDETYPVYYFILNKRWKAKETCELVLKMDTLNTFTLARNSFTISPRTLVDREHKNRFERSVNYSTISPIQTLPIYNKEFRVTKDISITGTFEANNENEIVVREYSANGNLDATYKGYWLEFYDLGGGLGYSLKLENSNGDILWNKSKFNITSLYDQNKFITIEFTQNLADFPNSWDWFNAIRNVIVKRIVDFNSEGLFPVKYHDSFNDIEINLDERNWYLIYKNRDDIDPNKYNQVNPVECYLCSDVPTEVKGVTNVYNVDSSDLTIGHYYTILKEEQNNVTIYFDDTAISINAPLRQAFVIKKNADSTFLLEVYILIPGQDSKLGLLQTSYDNISEFSIVDGNNMYDSSSVVGAGTTIASIKTGTAIDISINDTFTTIASIADIDRTDAKLIKIIKLPYCPTGYDVDTGHLGNGEWMYDGAMKMPKLINLNARFYSEFTISQNPINDLFVDAEIFIVDPTQNKDVSWESKLYHSDYYSYKFVYDSFSLDFRLETLGIDYVTKEDLKIDFFMTSTINSKFMFKLPQYVPVYSESDFDNIVVVNRNNEMPLYTSAYINWLKTGFNYDVKAKNRQEAVSAIGTGLSIVGAIASFASAAYTGGVGIVAGIGLATTAVAGVVQTANTIAQSEQNIQAKQEQLKNQATSVSGSDDVDLMSEYCNNKARLIRYEISPRMKKAMFDVFYYTGYVSGQMKVPDMTSRVWFNFVKCDIIFTSEENIPSECVDDLKELFNAGVTIMHRYNGVWDWDRTKENWEVNLL